MRMAMIFIILAPGFSLQHRHRESDSSSVEPDDSQQVYDYEQSPYYYRSSKKHKHKKHSYESKYPMSAELDSSNKKYMKNEYYSPSRHSKKHLRNNCDGNECQPDTEPGQVEQQGLSPGNLVFVPYPYPLVVPPPVPMPPLPPMPPPMTLPPATNITTSTAPSLTHVTTECDGRKHVDKDYFELLRSLKHRQELPFRSDFDNVRPVRHILQRLLSRVRNVKDINSV